MAIIDIAIPNYNYGRYLRACVASAQDQGIDDIRILIIDNASSDDSVEVARQLAAEDPRIELQLNEVNRGVHASLNGCVDWAQSPYFMLLHADDLLVPGALKRAIAFLEAHPNVGMCHGATIPDGRPVPDAGNGAGWRVTPGAEFIEKRCRTAQNTVACCSVVTRTSVHKQAGLYSDKLWLTPDLDLWLRFARLGDIGYTDDIQGISRVHAHNVSAATRDRLARELLAVEAAFELFFDREEAAGHDVSHWRQEVKRSVVQRAYWSALAHLVRGSYAGSWELVRMVAERRPGLFAIPPVGYIFKRNDSLARLADSASQAVARRFRTQ